MTKNRGFGNPPAQPKASTRSQERNKAAQQYEKMKSDGTPDYEIYIRIKDKKNWYPVGVVAVKRSDQINRAIFDSREQLLQGAFRLFPILRKNQQNLEYGYRLKEFKDESIQVAVPPKARAGGVKDVVSGLTDRVSSLFKRK